MKAFDDHGRELDALFSIRPVPGGAQLVIESRGGGEGGPRPPRNRDYAPALELLLRRLGDERATLTEIEVFSRETQNWPIEQRRIPLPSFPLPIALATLTETTKLRHELGRASAALGRAPEKSTGGNPTKKLRLTVSWPAAKGKSAEELEDRLARPPTGRSANDHGLQYEPLGAFLRAQSVGEVRLPLSEIARILGHALPKEAWTPQFWANAVGYHQTRRRQWLDAGFRAFFERRTETVLFRRDATDAIPSSREQPTADPDELRRRARRAKKRRQGNEAGGAPPTGSNEVPKAATMTSRYVRDPEVIAWVLVASAGSCEVCDAPAPFSDKDGEPYLEVHHVRPLGEGGPDQPDNAVAACPNCHRRLHFGADRDDVRSATIRKVARLVDYPARQSEPGLAGAGTFRPEPA